MLGSLSSKFIGSVIKRDVKVSRQDRFRGQNIGPSSRSWSGSRRFCDRTKHMLVVPPSTRKAAHGYVDLVQDERMLLAYRAKTTTLK